MRLEVLPRELRMREPLTAAWGTLERRRLLEVRLVAGDGLVGIGEAAPLEPYDGVSLTAVREQIESCIEVLAAGDEMARTALLDACRPLCPLPQALAAIDLALWDLEGRRAHLPVSALLSDAPAGEVAVNATISAIDRAGAGAQARAAAAAGFRCLKVKVGFGGDAGRVAAVRAAAGRGAAIRLDANGAWTVERALDELRSLATGELELCEEPVHGVADLRAVRQALEGRVAIAMDETASDPGAIGAGAVDAVCLKISRCGGIGGLIEAAATARAAGADVYLASTLDGPAGIAAALHAAAALGVSRPCGLATLGLFADCPNPFPVRGGRMAVPAGPGLGLA